MEIASEIELNLINLQIGCMLRLARLKQNLSQHSLGIKIDYSSTMIGRVERAESVSGWDKIYTISRYLRIDFNSLFVLKSLPSLISIVEDSFNLEVKLTQEKIDYYNFLKKTLKIQFDLLEKERQSKG
ncbi:helix-turn-helix domain-containing protein [Flavobacterium pectinovorum]|uniref:helix-turn-helix domain-containing protein n=1 Tax=Flavobacterium pectinovorum TaxID=29533 RepID=UPI001FAB5F35|nr:helix-turn-helix transcriptional regulator [Flavobacterium pectinovorum]MCI9843505.1 helix-turn-helix transcriptional regulator [Flavobacterium pectinovorum]